MAVQIHELLALAVESGASDIHLSAGEIPSLRVEGEIRRLATEALSADEMLRMAYSVMNEKQKSTFETEKEIDFSVGLEGLARFRVNVYSHVRGVGMVLRLIPHEVKSLDQLGAPQVLRRIAETRRGLVLVTGPTGSGKSTTLAAMVDHINATRNAHILTVEDPIEFIHTPKNCIINQREVGGHTISFTRALKSALREDPDVILVGELRDLETISLALTAAETGHLVFGTLHTNSAPETVDRLIDVFPPEQQQQIRVQLASSLMSVVSQVLERPANRKGRIALHEILIVTPAVRNLVREGKSHQVPSIMQTSKGEGMQTMSEACKRAVDAGLLTRQQAEHITNDPHLFDGPVSVRH